MNGIDSCYRLLENCHQTDIRCGQFGHTGAECDSERREFLESRLIMNLALKCSFAETITVPQSVDSQIRGFLAGDNDGEDLLHAIYDHVLDEPVPERLKALLKP